MVYYPLWVVRYSFQNRTYQVIVDGEDESRVCYGKAPGNNLYRAFMGIVENEDLMSLFCDAFRAAWTDRLAGRSEFASSI